MISKAKGGRELASTTKISILFPYLDFTRGFFDLVQVATLVPRAAGLVGLGGGVVGQSPASCCGPASNIAGTAGQPDSGHGARNHGLASHLPVASDGADPINTIRTTDLESDGEGRSLSSSRPTGAVVDVRQVCGREGHVHTVADRVLVAWVDGHGDRSNNASSGTATRQGVGRIRGRTCRPHSVQPLSSGPSTTASAVGGVRGTPAENRALPTGDSGRRCR